jgi:arabinofuranosyltransferase
MSETNSVPSKKSSWSKPGNLVFGLILLAYVAYAAVFILRSSFIVGGERYFVLFDDAMISMRYAKNLASGYGLVWNPGETPVEGYTNPLWTVWMAVLHLLPLQASKISLLVQVSGAVFILASLFFVRKIAYHLSGSELVALLAVTLTAFYMPLNNWALLGMEVSVLVLLLCMATWWFLLTLQTGRFSAWPYVLLGIGTLVRFDIAVPFLIGLGFMLLVDAPNRRKHLLWGLGLLAIGLGTQTLFRLVYYKELLPNTYYLKVTGYSIVLRVLRGLYALYYFVWGSNWLLCLLPFMLLFYRRDRQVMLVFALLLGQVAYSVYVGGDAWEHRGGSNRYIAVAIPLFFVLFVYATAMLINTLVAKLQSNKGATGEAPSRAFRAGGLILIVIVLISMVNFNFLLWKDTSLQRWLLMRQPMFATGNNDYVVIAQEIDKITTPQAHIGVVAAGTTPYFSGRPAIDFLGKSDPKIAREPAHNTANWADLEKFRPGHMKWDYDYSIGELKPDVIVQLWGDTKTAMEYEERDYVAGGTGSGIVFALRKGSPNILWDQVKLCTENCLSGASDSGETP